jgi:pimeloyl-ACP methyl ester carboxylesterase
VVLVHGWGCSAYEWRANLPALGAVGWRAVAVEPRGHGLSSKPREASAYAQAAMVRHLLAILDALGARRVPLVGHSLGGQLALHAALVAPERVSRLALAAPVGFGHVTLARIAQLLTPDRVVPWLPRFVTRALVRLALRLASGSMRRAAADDVEQYWAPSCDPGYAIAARHLLHGCRWREHKPELLARVRIPTLVVFGTRDRLVNGREAARLVSYMPESRLEVIRGAGHVIPSEAGGRFNALLLDFLGAPRHEDAEAAPPRA